MSERTALATILEGTIREIVRQELAADRASTTPHIQPVPQQGRWMTPPAAAREVGISEKAVRAMIKDGLVASRLRNVSQNPRQPKYLVDVVAVSAEAGRVSRVVHNDQMLESITERAERIRSKGEGR